MQHIMIFSLLIPYTYLHDYAPSLFIIFYMSNQDIWIVYHEAEALHFSLHAIWDPYPNCSSNDGEYADLPVLIHVLIFTKTR